MIYDADLLAAFVPLGMRSEDLERFFPKNYYIVVTWGADNQGQASVEKLISISELTLLDKQRYSTEIGTLSKILKYPYESTDLGFFKYCQILFPDNKNDLIEIFYDWNKKEIERQEEEVRKKDIKLDFNIDGGVASTKNLVNSFVASRVARQSSENIIEVINYVTRKSGKELFGSVIQKATQCVWFPVFGVVPVFKNSTFRYLFSGVKAANFNENEYDDAVFLLRQGYDFNYIRQKTGWTLDMPDGKPRKYISLKGIAWKDEVSFNNNIVNGEYLLSNRFIDGLSRGDINQYFYNSSKYLLFPTLSELLHAEDLFNAYPKLKGMRVCIKSDDNEPPNGSFIKSPHFAIYVNVNHLDWERALSTLLHEIQHAIQQIEGFAEGGNISFAKIVASSGVQKFKEIKILSKNFTTYLEEFLDEISKKGKDEEEHKREYEAASKYVSDFIVKYNNYINLNDNYDVITNLRSSPELFVFMLLNFLINKANQPNEIALFRSQVVQFFDVDNNDLPENFGRFFSLLTEVGINYNSYRKNIESKGYKSSKVEDLAFCYYIAFGGEIESRFVQGLKKINLPDDVAQAIRPLSLETQIENKYIYQGELDVTPKNFAYETQNDKIGCLHLSSTETGYELFHEIGHAVYDYFILIDPKNEILFTNNYVSENESITKGLNQQEYFAEAFCAYIKRKKIEENTTKFWPVDTKIGESLEIVFERIFMIAESKLEPIEEYKIYIDKFVEQIRRKNGE